MKALLFPARRRLFLPLAFLFALIALFPLRLAFDMLALRENGLSARAMEGGVWWGRIEQLSLAGIPLGTVDARLSPVQLLVGRARMDFVRQMGGPDDLKGAVSISTNSFGIDDVTATIGTGGIFAPLPVSGLDFQDVSVRFTKGACVHAEGRVKAMLAASVPGFDLPRALSGEAVCEGSALFLPLASQSGVERLNLRIEGNRRYRAEFLIRANEPSQAAALLANGFARAPGGYVLRLGGRL